MSASPSSENIDFIYAVYFPGCEIKTEKIMRLHRHEPDAHGWCIRLMTRISSHQGNPVTVGPSTTSSPSRPETWEFPGMINETGDLTTCYCQKFPVSPPHPSSSGRVTTRGPLSVIYKTRVGEPYDVPVEEKYGINWLDNRRIICVTPDHVDRDFSIGLETRLKRLPLY